MFELAPVSPFSLGLKGCNKWWHSLSLSSLWLQHLWECMGRGSSHTKAFNWTSSSFICIKSDWLRVLGKRERETERETSWFYHLALKDRLLKQTTVTWGYICRKLKQPVLVLFLLFSISTVRVFFPHLKINPILCGMRLKPSLTQGEWSACDVRQRQQAVNEPLASLKTSSDWINRLVNS